MRNPLIALTAVGFVLASCKPVLKDAPTSWDWRERQGVVPEVKNQTDGMSPSWAFAVTSAVESRYAIKYNQGASLSV